MNPLKVAFGILLFVFTCMIIMSRVHVHVNVLKDSENCNIY